MAQPKVSTEVFEQDRPALLRVVVDNQSVAVVKSNLTAYEADQALLLELESVAILSEN